jgi:hypothetical protein
MFNVKKNKLVAVYQNKYNLFSKKTYGHRFFRFNLSQDIENILHEEIKKMTEENSSKGIHTMGVFYFDNLECYTQQRSLG